MGGPAAAMLPPTFASEPLPSPSGKVYVVAGPQFMAWFPEALQCELLAAQPGDLIEVVARHGAWCLGMRLICGAGGLVPGLRSEEGAFRAEWAHGVGVAVVGGYMSCVPVDTAHFECRSPVGIMGHFHAKLRQQRLERVDRLWTSGASEALAEAERAEHRAREQFLLLRQALHPSAAAPPAKAEPPPDVPPALQVLAKLAAFQSGPRHPAACTLPFPPGLSLSRRLDGDEGGGAGASPGGGARQSAAAAERKGRRHDSPEKMKGESPPERRFARSLLRAKRSGELQALVEEWQHAQTAMVSSASDLQALKDRFKAIMIGAHRTGELHRVAGELASEVERRADEFQKLKERALKSLLQMKRAGMLERLAQERMATGGASGLKPAKERALRSLLDMKRSGELERLAQEMGDTQQKLEVKAVQLREVAARMRRGLLDAHRSGELERIAGEMEQVIETKMETILGKVRRSLLQAHRAGVLHELRGELDELADVVPKLECDSPNGPPLSKSVPAGRASAAVGGAKKRWSEMTTSSDSDMDPRARQRGLGQHLREHSVDSLSDSVSESDGPPARGQRPAIFGRSASSSSALGQVAHKEGPPPPPDSGVPRDAPAGEYADCERSDDAATGGSDSSGTSETRGQPSGVRRKKDVAARGRFARSLLNAKRSGKLQALVEELQQARSAMVSSTSDLQALKQRFHDVTTGAHATGELHRVAGDLASEVQRRADGFQQLKERALRSLLEMKRAGELERLAQEMASEAPSGRLPAKERALRRLLEMKRSGELELLAQEMGDTQETLEAKALQLREIAAHMWQGVRDARRTGELERIAGEMEQVLDTKMQTIRERVRRSLLRAHRTGELHELRGELDELADAVSTLSSAAGAAPARAVRPAARRWSEFTSSDSDRDTRAAPPVAAPSARAAAAPAGEKDAARDSSTSGEEGGEERM